MKKKLSPAQRFNKPSDPLLDEYCIVQKNTHLHSIAHQFSFTNIDSNISGKQGFGRDNYDWFRSKEAIPQKRKDIMQFCQTAYESFGIIHNIIDLMGDFACQGISLVHPNPKIEKIYQNWFDTVKGRERSERFLNILYRLGIVATYRSTAKFRKKDVERLLVAKGEADSEIQIPVDIDKNEVPVKYTFLNPACIEVFGNDLASFTSEPIYGLRISDMVKRKIVAPTDNLEKEIIMKLPKAILDAAKNGNTLVRLDENRTSFYHYKKDDWAPYGLPMIYPVLRDIIMLEKLKLTDMAACDGAISTVRLWTIGSLEKEIAPTPAAISKLASILTNNTGGGTFDLIWGPELTFKESQSNIHQFLGKDKYEPTLNAIFAGLGIPPTLTGTTQAGGLSSNFISLKTLIERLEYGRSILQQFWEQEIRLVQKALGISSPAIIKFDRMTLSDESSERALLVSLVDRDIISGATVLERLGEIPEIEQSRIKKEYKMRDSEKMPEKAGPYHNADAKDDFTKMFIQQGIITPGEVGLELEERKPGEIPYIDQQMKNQEKLGKIQNKQPKGTPGEGRPKNTPDKSKRKKRVDKPRSSASFFNTFNWAEYSQAKVNEIILPIMLNHFSKANARGLTTKENNLIEELRFGILLQLEPMKDFNEENIYNIAKAKAQVSEDARKVYNSLIGTFMSECGREPTLVESRRIQAYTYSLLNTEDEDNG